MNQWGLVIDNYQRMAWPLSAMCFHLAPSSLLYLRLAFTSPEGANHWRSILKIQLSQNRSQKKTLSSHDFKMEMGSIHAWVLPLLRVVSRSSSILISKLWIQFCAIMMSQFLEYERANLSYFWITHLEARVFLYFHISRVALNLILAPFLSINHCCVS